MSFYSVLYIAEWIARIAMLFVVVRKRQPAAALAWLAIIFFQPWIGIFLYLIIGRHRLPRRRARQHGQLLKRLKHLKHQLDQHPNIAHPELGPQCKGAITLAERFGLMPILNGNEVEWISDSEQGIHRMIEDIAQAREHVHMLFFIFRNDETGKRVADSLKMAAQRGVKCRLLVDSVGSWRMLHSLRHDLQLAGIEVVDALPVGFLRRQASRIDLRNHRKIVIIDGRIGYTGSQNIADADYGHKTLVWRDLTVRLKGPIVQELQMVFLEDWNFRTEQLLQGEGIFPPPQSRGTIPCQTLPSGPNYPVENYQRWVVAAMHSARDRVYLTTPYFIPDAPLLEAMQVIAQRGVAVHLVVPGKTDHPIVDMAGRAYFSDLLEAGVRIFIYNAGLLHAKTLSIDDSIAFIGSSNFDIRSFALNFEINLLLYGSEVTQDLRRCQLEYLHKSRRLDPAYWKSQNALKNTIYNVAKLFSPLL
ncbi:MAG: cardiolipin synthase [Sedimentisphaerales bacterium]|nr:cardiolipin synthase [Sedimentisphaerales bacterium]